MVVATAQTLETFGDDGLLMEELDYTLSNYAWAGRLRATYLSAAVVQYNLLGSFLSLFLVDWAGKGTYSEFIKTAPEITEDSGLNTGALNMAGSVCLMLNCVLLAALGYTLKHFIRHIAKVVTFSACSFSLFSLICISCFMKRSNFKMKVLNVIFCLNDIFVIILIIIFNDRLLLLTNPLFLNIIVVAIFGKRYGFYLNPAPVPVMLMIGEVFAFHGTNVLDLQKVVSNPTALALEGLFYGLWNNQLFTMSVAMSVFGSWQTGSADIISLAALGSGSALLVIITGMITVLDPWPLLGVLTGVAGAAGLALSAAGTAAGRFGWPGTVGAVLGAGVGAFLGSLSHGGVSGTFIALSTALIPAYNHPMFLLLLKDVIAKYCEE